MIKKTKEDENQTFLFRNPKIEKDDDINASFEEIKKFKNGTDFFYYYTQKYQHNDFFTAKEKMMKNCHLVYKYKKNQYYIGKSYDYQIITEDDKNHIFTVKYFFKKTDIINCGSLKANVFEHLKLQAPKAIVHGILESQINNSSISGIIKNYMKTFINIFDISAKTKLLYRSCQSGKTAIIINLIKNRKNKTIFFTDNFINQKNQLISRLSKITKFKIISLSGNKKMTDDNINEYLDSDIIIACTNSTQRKNVLKILEKTNEKYDIYIDEIDSRFKVFTDTDDTDNNFYQFLLDCSKVIKIGTITATPKKLFEYFSKNHYKLSLYHQESTFEIDNYHKLEDLNFCSLETIKIDRNDAKIFYPSNRSTYHHLLTRNTLFDNYNCDAVIVNNNYGLKIHFKEKINRNIQKEDKESIKNEGEKINIKTLIETNNEVKELLIKILDEKNIKIDQELNKMLNDNIIISRDDIIDDIIKNQTLELSELLPLIIKYYNLNDKKVGLTGKSCLGRGITINSPYFMITDAIFDYKKLDNLCNLYQLIGRLCGNFLQWNNYEKINIFCNEDLKTAMLTIEDIACNFYYKHKNETENHLENYKKMFGEKIIYFKNNEYDIIVEKFKNSNLEELQKDINKFIKESVPYYDEYHFKQREFDLNGFIIEKYDSKNKSKKSCEDIKDVLDKLVITNHLNRLKDIGHSHRVYYCYEDLNDNKTLCAYYKYVQKKSDNFIKENIVEEIIDDEVDDLTNRFNNLRIDYTKMKINDLKKLCKEKGIKGYSKFGKKELIKKLEEQK